MGFQTGADISAGYSGTISDGAPWRGCTCLPEKRAADADGRYTAQVGAEGQADDKEARLTFSPLFPVEFLKPLPHSRFDGGPKHGISLLFPSTFDHPQKGLKFMAL